MADVVVVASDEATVEIVRPEIRVVEIVTEGPAGPAGPIADLGDVLEAVDIAVTDYFVLHPQSFVYDQLTAVYHWDIVHPLDHRPAVVVTDSAGNQYQGEVKYPASNRATIDFNFPLAGRATLT